MTNEELIEQGLRRLQSARRRCPVGACQTRRIARSGTLWVLITRRMYKCILIFAFARGR
jgi:hypothetical protein